MLEQLRSKVQSCKNCPLHREIMVLPTIGIGSSKPDIMFIIGGVDRESLIFEKPFNQVSETVLVKCLHLAHIPMNKCYITSIIKCGTLKDKKANIDTCSDWLMQEIFELQPKVLFFIGKKTHELFYKKFGDIGAKTFIEDSTLQGIFARSSLMKGFVERLKLANGFCS